MIGFPVFVVFVILIIGFRIIAGGFDKDRITGYARARGWKVSSIEWTPFGTGWFGSKNERIYTVAYETDTGEHRVATCKTSMWSGVYFTDENHYFQRMGSAPAPVKICPRCAAASEASAKFCKECGEKLAT